MTSVSDSISRARTLFANISVMRGKVLLDGKGNEATLKVMARLCQAVKCLMEPKKLTRQIANECLKIIEEARLVNDKLQDLYTKQQRTPLTHPLFDLPPATTGKELVQVSNVLKQALGLLEN